MTEQEIITQVAAESPSLLVFVIIAIMLYRTAPQFLEAIHGMRKDAQEREQRKIKDARSRDEFQARMLESQREQKDYMNKTFDAINKTQTMIAEQISIMKSHNDSQSNLYSLAQDSNMRLIAIEEQAKIQTERIAQVFERIDHINTTKEN